VSINALIVQAVLSETGVDMGPWPTSKHFTSWLSICHVESVNSHPEKRLFDAKTELLDQNPGSGR